MTDTAIETFAPIQHGRTSDEIVHQIERLLLDGILCDGERLPSERDLSQRFDVSRPILREALKTLIDRGLLVSHHGGGTFVADVIGQIFSKPMIALIARHQKATEDYLEYRRELEGLTADMAARRATPFDRDRLTRIMDDMRADHAAGSFEGGLTTDIELHHAIGECAHNVILLHTLRACYRLLTEDIFFNRKTLFSAPGAGDLLFAQHEAIYRAIMNGDPAAARQAAQTHIDYVILATRENARAGEWTRIAQMRLQQSEKVPSTR